LTRLADEFKEKRPAGHKKKDGRGEEAFFAAEGSGLGKSHTNESSFTDFYTMELASDAYRQGYEGPGRTLVIEGGVRGKASFVISFLRKKPKKKNKKKRGRSHAVFEPGEEKEKLTFLMGRQGKKGISRHLRGERRKR